MERYDSTMGAIEEDEIEKYILKIQDTLYTFNDSYLDKEYRYIQTKSTSYFNKIADLYLTKLKANIELSSSIFSTILTRDVYKKLEENLLQQYYKIESYIYNCNITKIENIRDKFLFLLNETSSLIEYNYIYFNGRVKNYYEVFSNLIQKNIKYISEEELREYKKRKLEKNKVDKYSPEDVWNKFKKSFRDSKNDFDKISNLKDYCNLSKKKLTESWDNAKKIFEKDEKDSVWSNSFKKKEIDLGISFEITNKEFSISVSPCLNLLSLNFTDFYFPILIFPGLELAINIVPSFTIDICLSLGFKVEYESGNSLLSIGGAISANVGITLSLGLYIPTGVCPLHFEFTIGFEGVLGNGKVGLDLIFFNEEDKEIYSLNFYYSIKAISVNFFIKVGIYFSFKLGIIKFNWSLSYTIYEIYLFTLYTRKYQMIIYYKNITKIACTEKISEKFAKTLYDDNDDDNDYDIKNCL